LPPENAASANATLPSLPESATSPEAAAVPSPEAADPPSPVEPFPALDALDAPDPEEEAEAVQSLDKGAESGALLPEAPETQTAPSGQTEPSGRTAPSGQAAPSDAVAPERPGSPAGTTLFPPRPDAQEETTITPPEKNNRRPLSEITRRNKRAAAALAAPERPASDPPALPQGESPLEAEANPASALPSAVGAPLPDTRAEPLHKAAEADAVQPDEAQAERPEGRKVPLPLSRRIPPALPPEPAAPELQAQPLSRVITYGKASPAAPGSKVMRGTIPPEQLTPEARRMGNPSSNHAPAGRRTSQASSGTAPVEEDKVLPLSVVEDFSRFLAANFWPRGTHPMAREQASSTAGAKWANVIFGAQLQGFAPSSDPAGTRKRVLERVFTSAGVKTLYALYAERFFSSLERQARVQSRGANNTPLSDAQMADMYTLYGNMAHGLAGAIRAFMRTPNIRDLVSGYAQASTDAGLAYRRFADSLRDNDGNNSDVDSLDNAKAYQAAIMSREQKREELAAALRRHGALPGLDSDSLVYVAQWLYRRGQGKDKAFAALADVLDTCAVRLAAVGDQHRLGAIRSADASHE
jgi:hypothetical protein